MHTNKKIYYYPAIFYAQSTGGYTVLFPNFYNIGTQGESFGEATEKAREILESEIQEYMAEGIPIPDPIPSKEIIFDEDIGRLSGAKIVVMKIAIMLDPK